MTDFLSHAHHLADLSGAILRRYFRAPLTVDIKSDASPVTMADKEVEQALRDYLQKHLPEHGILGEEFAPHQPNAEYQWVIDPIDGTRAFIAGIATFTTLISLT